MSDTPKKATGKSRPKLAKSPTSKSIDPKEEEDDVTLSKSYYRGKSSDWTPELGLSNVDWLTKPTEEVEPTK